MVRLTPSFPIAQTQAQALLRRKQRAGERGAVVFLVLFALTLLSGLGIWALHTTTMTEQASGYSRAALQTQYVAELGVHAGTAFLAFPGWASVYYNLAFSRPDTCETTQNQRQQALALGQPVPFCKSLYMSDIDGARGLNQEIQANLLDLPADTPGTVPGSTGSSQFAPVQADFSIEITDPQTAILPGSDLSKAQYRRVTLTSRGMLRPRPLGSTNSNFCEYAAENSVATRVGVRAHSILGPL